MIVARHSRPKRSRLAFNRLLAICLLLVLLVGLSVVVPIMNGSASKCMPRNPKPIPFHPDLSKPVEKTFSSVVNGHGVDEVAAPGEAGGNALRVAAMRSDEAMTPNPRVQLSSSPAQGIPYCSEFWMSVSIYLPAMSDREVAQFLSVPAPHINYVQLYGRPYFGSAPLIFEQFSDDQLTRRLGLRANWRWNEGSYSHRLWSVPVIEDQWFRIVWHVKVSPNRREGFVEFYFGPTGKGEVEAQRLQRIGMNGSRSQRIYYPTMELLPDYRAGDGMRIDLQSYRPKRIPLDRSIVYFCDERIDSLEHGIGWAAADHQRAQCAAFECDQ